MTTNFVSTGWRFGGGVAMMDKSRAPISEKCKVLGMGVAVKVSTSTSTRISFNRSLTLTPNFCSSSIIIKPRFLNSTSLLTNRWVPMRISVSPVATLASVSLICLLDLKRLMYSTLQGNAANRSWKVLKCCIASTVVGTRTATCLESATALKAALIAISVLPKPTSPQTKRSIGCGFSISIFTSAVAFAWSGVSSYIKEDSNSACK